jgi:hypothetical protein
MEEPDLTEEHIIPKELGGRLVTLTCKDCNNSHGHEIDAHLIQMLRALDSVAGIGRKPLRGRIQMKGITVPTDVDWKASVQEVTTFRLRRFNPAVHEAIQQHMRDGEVESFKITLSLDYIPARACLGVLRIAYLVMFRELGYSYILSSAARVVREMLKQYANPPTEVSRLAIEVGEVTPTPAEPWQLYAVGGGIAIMVLITLRADTKRIYATFMPSPELSASKVLEVLADAAKSIVE